MKKNKILCSILAIFVLLSFIGCGNTVNVNNSEKDNSSNGTDEIDYENYQSYSVRVRNNTSQNLVVFKGTPSSTTLISGVPASATNHGLKKDSALFSKSSDFVLFFVTEEDYLANKDSLANLANRPFARLYAYYNDNSVNEIIYEISSKMGGAAKLNLNNNTAYNVELRKDSIYGEVIGYTGARTINTTFNVEPGDYYIFPVFRKFDKNLNEIVTVYPKDSDGDAYVEVLNITDSEPMELNASKWSTNVTFTSGYAYFKIANESATGISLYDGENSTAETTSTGGKIINSGSSLIYQIKMTKVGSGYNYDTSVTKASLRYGNSMKNDYKVPSNVFEAGKLYTFTVTGDDYKNLTGKFTGEPVSVSDDMEISQM